MREYLQGKKTTTVGNAQTTLSVRSSRKERLLLLENQKLLLKVIAFELTLEG